MQGAVITMFIEGECSMNASWSKWTIKK